APGDAGAVQQVGHVGPSVDRRRPAGVVLLAEVGWIARALQRVGAAGRLVVGGAVRRPFGNLEQVLGQRPGGVGFEHVVLQHEVVGVGPVVGDVPAVVVTHHVGAGAAAGTGRVVRVGAAPLGLLRLADEPVHLPAVDVGGGVDLTVRAAAVDVGGVVERALAAAGRIRRAHRRRAAGRRDAIRAGVG